MATLELHADTRGTRFVLVAAGITSAAALIAALVVIWFEPGGTATLAVFGLLFPRYVIHAAEALCTSSRVTFVPQVGQP